MYKFIAGQRKTILASYLKIGTFTNSYKYFTKKINPDFINLRNNLNAEYWLEESDIKLLNKFGEEYLKKEFIGKIIKEIKRHNKTAQDLVQLLNDVNFASLNNRGLINLFNRIYDNLFEMMGTIFLSQDVFTKAIEEKLKVLIENEIKNKDKRDYYFNLLIKSYNINGINKEKIDWYNFIINDKAAKNKLREYILSNGWLVYNSFYYKEIESYINKRYEEIKDISKDKIKKEIRTYYKKSKIEKENFDKKTKYFSSEIKFLSKTLRDLSELRLDIKILNNSLEVALNLKLLYYIASKFKINFIDLLDGYFYENIVDLINKNKKVSKKEIENRKKYISYVFVNGKLKLSTGEKAKKIASNILKNSLPDVNQKILKGQIASKGKIIGVARIIELGDNKQFQKDMKRFKRGEIIVTIMTQPNIMPIVAKSSGIITDEGGICSHAAIISRELKIPCIVGTESATKIIKDGDLVEISTEENVVKILN